MPDKKNRALAFLTAAFLALALAEPLALRLLEPLENRLSDVFLRLQAQRLAPDPEIVIVDIDDASLAAMSEVAGSWPWPRSVHGELIEGLARQQPRAIVFDVMFAEPDLYRPESDALLSEAVRAHANVYLPVLRQDPALDAYGVPLHPLAAALGAAPGPAQARAALLLPRAVAPEGWRLGAINFLEDRDGVGRRYHLHLPVEGWSLPSLPARVAKDLGYTLPAGRSMILGWSAAKERQRVPYAALYADFSRKEPKRAPAEFRGRIVVVGTTASGLHDIRATPVSSLYPAVDILATALDNLKNRGWMEALPAGVPAWLGLALVLGLGAASWRRVNTLGTGAGLAAATGLLLAASWWAAGNRLLLPVFSPVAIAWAYYFAAALAEYLRERAERERAVQLFSRFVNPHVVRELIARGGLSREGESRQVTVLFSDIRGFTTLSETRAPTEVVDLLNRYFSRQVDVIFRHGGSLDKFIGDAIMALWGAPLDDPEHARHAIACALEMADTLVEFRREAGDLAESFDVGIGLHSGPAVVGLIGSEQRREYTAIGDTVNLASRIEGLTKGVARILVSEDTMRLAAQHYEFIDRGSFKVKGRAQEVRLFEPVKKA
ncbi:MAG TPA: adenylate/guanylate cyclase domain-containing protein [Burkholderiales bacterium]